MLDNKLQWLGRFLPQPNTVPRAERMRSVAGALVGLLTVAGVSMALTGKASVAAALVAPMGASAVLLFCVPASPLAQPWSVIGGNTVAALIGVACAHAIGNPLLAAPLAGCLAILAMFLLRCLHPPSGAVALTAVLGGTAIHDAGFMFAFAPVLLNSCLIVLAALAFNNLTGRRYPHSQKSTLQNTHATRDPVPTARLGFSKEDLDAALARYGQVLDVSRDDLEHILFETEMQAYGRRFGVITCGEIMSKDVVTLQAQTSLSEAWRLLRHHRVHALPVLAHDRRVAGIVGQGDFLHHAGLDEFGTVGERLRELAGIVFGYRSNRPEVVAEIMATHVTTVREDEPIAELVPMMANSGLHHIPVVDRAGVFVGIVSQSDLLAALYESRLAAA
jgi:CBS domain-containing membrane protein